MSVGFAQRVQEPAAEAKAGQGVSQADIARELRVERATVSHWFSGRSEPKGGSLAALAEFLAVRWQWLADGRGPKRADIAVDLITTNYDAEMRAFIELVGRMPADSRRMLEQIARGDLALHGELGDDAGAATMDIRKEAQDMITAWLSLPANERDEFKRSLETASLRYRKRVPDERLSHLAAPGTPAAAKAKARKTPSGTQ